ncbi:hypothetical protein HZA98_03285 [Candidatus Woesearchaeota archaeon]|nr:hypothetical protein [Candidatus Woesearchaeota archaeon]
MDENITLENLAKSAHAVYIDLSVYEKESSQFHHQKIQKDLGFVNNMSRTREAGIHGLFMRQEDYAAGLLELLKSYQNIYSTPYIFAEHKKFIQIVRRKVQSWRENNRSRKDILSCIERILATHKEIVEILEPRVQQSTEDKCSLTYQLVRGSYHKPRVGYFKKKDLIEETSQADAELVSFAVDEAMITLGPIAIVTSDFDIPNMLYNLVLASNGELGRETEVSVYFPDFNFWPENFDLEFMVDSKGRISKKRRRMVEGSFKLNRL